MIPGLRWAVIPDPLRFSELRVMYPVPAREDHWGVLAPLRDTPWGTQIPTVSGEALSHAFHGEPKFLREMLGQPPRIRGQRLPVVHALCALTHNEQCVLAGDHCRPGSGALPDCYQAPYELSSVANVASAVGKAWDEGRYVFVVEGPEFMLTGV